MTKITILKFVSNNRRQLILRALSIIASLYPGLNILINIPNEVGNHLKCLSNTPRGLVQYEEYNNKHGREEKIQRRFRPALIQESFLGNDIVSG